jgi:hypothetical protein
MSELTLTNPLQIERSSSLSRIIDKNKKLFLSYLTFLVVYAVFTLVPHPNVETLARYHLTSMGLRAIYLTIVIIVAIIWGAGFYGYAKLRAYAKMIRRQKDGQKVEMLSRGIFLLVMWLPISEVVSAVLNYVALRHPSLLPSFTIINNYINLLLPLGAFIFIGMAARGLSGIIKNKYNYGVSSIIPLFIAYVGVAYVHLVASTGNRSQVYHLSLWVILLTIVAPYMYIWFTGAVAVYELYNYQKLVSGVLYRKSWSFLAIGCGWLIVTSMIFQYLTTLGSRLNQLSIYWLLAIIYSLLAVLSIGFILIAMGASRLQKIEEV